MTCTDCGKSITLESSVTEEGYHFCNALCRYEWRTKGKPTPFASKRGSESPSNVAVGDLEFPIEPPGFENRQMRVRLSYWASPKIFLDGNPLQPVKSGFLGRKREYVALSNFGKQVSIRLRAKPFDQVPDMEIGGQQFLIARPLNRWEYIWMAIPVLLIVLGGGIIGGAIGMAAVFSNSILMRRIGHWIPRYVLTGGTTVTAFLIFFRVTTTVSPLLQSFGAYLKGQTVEEQLVEAGKEYNIRCPFMLDEETRVDSISIGPGKILTYNYTLVNRSVDELDISQVKEYVRPSIVNNARTSPDMKKLRELEVSFAYRYVDKNGHLAFDLTVNPPEYR